MAPRCRLTRVWGRRGGPGAGRRTGGTCPPHNPGPHGPAVPTPGPEDGLSPTRAPPAPAPHRSRDAARGTCPPHKPRTGHNPAVPTPLPEGWACPPPESHPAPRHHRTRTRPAGHALRINPGPDIIPLCPLRCPKNGHVPGQGPAPPRAATGHARGPRDMSSVQTQDRT